MAAPDPDTSCSEDRLFTEELDETVIHDTGVWVFDSFRDTAHWEVTKRFS